MTIRLSVTKSRTGLVHDVDEKGRALCGRTDATMDPAEGVMLLRVSRCGACIRAAKRPPKVPKVPKAPRVPKEPRIYRVEMTEESKARARAATDGELDDLPWTTPENRLQIIEAIALARAWIWRHEMCMYEVEDCQHVAAMLRGDVRVSEIIWALIVAYRRPYWREHVPAMREVRRHLAEWCTHASRERGAALAPATKGDAIEAHHAAYKALPMGLRLDFEEEPDFTHQTTEQIMIGVRDMLTAAQGERRLRLVKAGG